MNKDQQDLSWACLPKEARDRIKIAYKSDYVSDRGYQPTRGMEVLQNVFGHHNLTSDTEPEEMLMNPRKEVQEYFTEINKTIDKTTDRDVKLQSIGKQTALKALFGDQCLPDTKVVNEARQIAEESVKCLREMIKEKPTPRFSKGDSVLHIPTQIVYDVEEYLADFEGYKLSRMSGVATCFAKESDLEPYTELKIGDKVRVIGIVGYAGEVTEIIAVDKSDPIAPYKLDLLDDEGGGIWCDGNAIEPYIEHETKEDTPRPHKYSVGQKVLNHYCKSEILTIGSLEGHADKKNPRYRVLGYPHLWNECELDPYTEHESRNLSQEIANCDKSPNVSADETKNETKDNTEEKELNLAELLKDAIGEEIYSPTFGVVKVSMANCNCIGVDPWNHNSKSFKTDGRYVDKADAVISLFPSKVLYEKYPLDAKKAWREWSEERKPKRWRAEEGKEYWYLSAFVIPEPTSDDLLISDNKLHESGNYFRTKEEAEQAAEVVREILMKIHEQNQK